MGPKRQASVGGSWSSGNFARIGDSPYSGPDQSLAGKCLSDGVLQLGPNLVGSVTECSLWRECPLVFCADGQQTRKDDQPGG